MSGLRNIAIRWYRKAFGAPEGADIRDEGFDTVLDGNSAVALAEASISSHAILGGSTPCSEAESVWLGERSNLYGETLSAQAAEGPRGVVAAATGFALAGRRATAFLGGPDLAAAQDLLISAAGRHAPLILHLGTRAATAHGSAIGSGHDCVHLSADAGAFMLFASNVQEAVDFTYIARCVAEQSLVPGIVVMDGEQTALAAQDVRLLSPAQVASLLGPAQEPVDAPSEAQKLLFGETRRRVPAWHDLDEPVLAGALFGRDDFALGALARGPYFDDLVSESLSECLTQFADKTGRHHEPLSNYRLDGAETVLLAQGAAVETARLAADYLRKEHRLRVGVVGIHALRPFPGPDIAKVLDGVERVLILERLDTPMSGEPPLTREVRASLSRLGVDRSPQCQAVVYGVGGLPLRVADLAELCTIKLSGSPAYLGLAFDNPSDDQPKRAVLLDALRRAYPAVSTIGVRASANAKVAAQKGTLTIAFRHGGDEIARLTAALLHRLAGGRVRSRPAIAVSQEDGVAWVTYGDDTLQDPGDDPVADVTVDIACRTIELGRSPTAYRAHQDAEGLDSESLLGGLFGVLLAADLVEAKKRRVIATREKLLEGVEPGRRERQVAAFRDGLEQIGEIARVPDSVGDRWPGEAPLSVRHLGREDDHYASLPRFWDQVGVLYRDEISDQLTAGPYLATGVMPPLSSTFNDLSLKRSRLPQFDAEKCTGCGKCWTHCPDSAIGVVAATPTALIDAGIRQTGGDAVRPMASKIASRVIADAKTGDQAASTFGAMLSTAFDWLEDKLPEDRRESIGEGVEKIVARLGALPIAVTEPFFLDPESRKKNSAELLSVVINPDACKDCGVCIASCEPGALTRDDQTPDVLDAARERWSTWIETPDTASETIERMAADPEFGRMAALLLSRYCQFAIAGGDPAEPGSGEKMAVRLLLSATEFHQQPLVQRFADSLSDAGEAISSLIRETLSGSLAVDDLDTITKQLEHTSSPRVDVTTLVEGEHSVDTEHLLRLIDLKNRIGAAYQRLVEGTHGLGRARYGLAVAGGSAAEWSGAFPHNPFQAPVLIDMTGDAAQLAAGLVEGHLHETTELVRLLRLAELEIEQPDGADWRRETLAGLRWQDLTAEEFAICPPLVLVGSDEMLAGRGLGQLTGLLSSGLPVKVLVLQSLDLGLVEPAFNRVGLGLMALSHRDAFVAQTSVACPDHLGESFLRALAHKGPALVQVYAPSPTRHGFSSEQSVAMAELAVTSRAMPLYRYDPATGGVFGSRISLEGNPLPHETLIPHGEEHQTPADWAIGQARFAESFTPLADDAPTPVPLGDWLALDSRGRLRKTPFVTRKEARYSIAPAILDRIEECVDGWRTLQELAGLRTPFTADVEQQVREDLAAEHQAELASQKQAFEDRISAMQSEMETEIASKIRSRLLQLVSRKRG